MGKPDKNPKQIPQASRKSKKQENELSMSHSPKIQESANMKSILPIDNQGLGSLDNTQPKQNQIGVKSKIQAENQFSNFEQQNQRGGGDTNPEQSKDANRRQRRRKSKSINRFKDIQLKSMQEIRAEVKKWSSENKNIRKRMKLREAWVHKKLQSEYEQLSEQYRKSKEQKQLLKRNQIRKNIENMEQNRRKRLELIEGMKNQKSRDRKNIIARGDQHEYMHQSLDKQYKKSTIKNEAKIRENIMRKKSEMLKGVQNIKIHEKQFLEHLKARSLKRKQRSGRQLDADNNTLISRHQSEFNLLLRSSDSVEKEKNLQKYKRRKEFGERVKSIPIRIDKQKMKQALIARDKAKNPLKYNYLSSLASMNDLKIYEEFQDFSININQKELGNQYMRKINQSYRNMADSRGQKTNSRSSPPQAKTEYKNYIPEVKSLLKKVESRLPENQVQEIIMKHDNNSQRLAELDRKSNFYENQAVRKIAHIYEQPKYIQTLKKEEQIDGLYLKSLKLKLASATLE